MRQTYKRGVTYVYCYTSIPPISFRLGSSPVIMYHRYTIEPISSYYNTLYTTSVQSQFALALTKRLICKVYSTYSNLKYCINLQLIVPIFAELQVEKRIYFLNEKEPVCPCTCLYPMRAKLQYALTRTIISRIPS